ncbi:serine hydrolase domain-containing protein [Sneathiella chinensis]|uniref:Serine hydrolase n=1 Tax=Sneathiella chinensis TaxID=349750 RepID=A0ABQ5U2S4_9PROT|nr:serine hydrolase domain-containing protein [Sneathiella chinensis]GLQ06128.1 serine hydrolase [Sneathiella chinensis]
MEVTARPEDLGFCKQRLENITDWMKRYVEAGKLPGAQTLVMREGEVVYSNWTGYRDVERAQDWTGDTIARFYSMTKPITSVALMTLYEKGLFHLDDPIERFIPAFADMRVMRKNAVSLDDTEPCRTKPTIHHLLTHCSGLTYDFNKGVLEDAYAEEKMDFMPNRGTLEDQVERLARLPLKFEPGTRWNYGVSTDVVGRLVEVISGKSLDVYLREVILEPLGMKDTRFDVTPEMVGRFASSYTPKRDGSLRLVDRAEDSLFAEGRVQGFSGGGGLVSTVEDYSKFAEMIRQRGALGEDGPRILGSRTVEFMMENHMPGDLASMGQPVFSEVSFEGVGFGLGGWVMLNPAKAQMLGTPGDFGWGGLASTVFWVDPLEDLTVVFSTQLLPSSYHPLRKEIRALVYQAMID